MGRQAVSYQPSGGRGLIISQVMSLAPVVMTQVSLPLSSHLSRALAKRCLSAALKGAGPPVCTPAERSSSMKLRMPSRAWMVSRV
ncbi:hypothetical protein D3C73_626980 [compost metagenome]